MIKLNQLVVVVLLLSVSLISCDDKKELTLQHSEKESITACGDEDSALLNEALFQFEQDITEAYDPEAKRLVSAYGRYLYVGFTGTAEFDRVATCLSIAIYKELLARNILLEDGGTSNLNYMHPAVQCVINNMEDKDLSTTINALVETNTMNPKLFNSRMRNFGRQAKDQRVTALYVALDAFYQHLAPVAQVAQESNE
ncbi:MAG: hypothetical protein OSB51_05110 [Dokdonia donghaensis]|nr:hypothetical protein [Dokdonia donghaensis]